MPKKLNISFHSKRTYGEYRKRILNPIDGYFTKSRQVLRYITKGASTNHWFKAEAWLETRESWPPAAKMFVSVIKTNALMRGSAGYLADSTEKTMTLCLPFAELRLLKTD